MRPYRRLIVLGVLVAVVGLGLGAAQAHFNLNLNVRVFQVEHTKDGLRLYMRVPMPYLVAGGAGVRKSTFWVRESAHHPTFCRYL